jgi:1-acyl-sn-glycerol-3-phosphate acyltransferase
LSEKQVQEQVEAPAREESPAKKAKIVPPPLPWPVRLRSNLVQAPPFLATTIVFGSLSLLASTFDKRGRVQHWLARWWARCSVWASWSRLKVVGAENFLGTQPAVYAANHTSYMDTPVVFASLPFQFRILAKIELWKLPFIGWYLDRSGQIPIDTANPRATVSSLGAGVKALRAGMPLFVFPEGGRTESGELQPFLNGAAYLAVRAQVPLVPVALIGVHRLLPPHTRHFNTKWQPLRLAVGPAIATEGRTLREVDAVTAELRAAIAGLIERYS